MQRGDCFGRFETRGVRAPHIEQLAEDGVRFATCITPNLVCQPARASMLTGMLPLTHGVYDNGVDPDPTLARIGFATQFADNGYDTAFFGKAHFSSRETFAPTGSPECKQSSSGYGDNWNGPYMGFDDVRLCVLGHLQKSRKPVPPEGQHYERWFASRGARDEAWQLHTTELEPVTGAVRTWNSALPAVWHTSQWVADHTIEFLNKRGGDKPFLVWASFPDPHHPYAPPAPWHNEYDHQDVTMPASHELDLERRPWWHKAALTGTPKLDDPALRQNRKDASGAEPQSDRQLAHMTANYFAMISQIDHHVGRILDVLDARGLAENTIVVYTSDHGDLLGDHGLYMKGPMPYEGLLRVGCVMRGPGIPKGRTVSDPVSTLDLAATFYEYCDLEQPPDIQSRSLRPLIETDSASRDVAYSEWHLLPLRCGVELQLTTVRTKTHKMTLEQKSGAGELYDLTTDPDEMENLFTSSHRSAVQRELEDMIRARPGPIRSQLSEPVGIA